MSSVCAHCSSPLGPDAIGEFCCAGCEAVYTLLHESGFERYYELRASPSAPVGLAHPERRDLHWLEPLDEKVRTGGSVSHLALDVQGMHCAGCVWLFDRVFEKEKDAVRVIANPTLGRIELWVGPQFDLPRFVRGVERFGYLLGPALKRRVKEEDALLVRTGIVIALAANAMMFALAIYLGLREGSVFETMRALEVVLATLAVAIGAPVFARAAVEGLRRGVLHLDLPITLGMLLALAGTIWAYFERPHHSYGDTVAIFVALMLLGRWLQRRVAAKNRDRLLESEGSDGLFTRRVEDGRVNMVRCSRIQQHDVLLIARGELVPVDATLLGENPTSVSLDWIHGESEPRRVEVGQTIAAGSFVVGENAIEVQATTSFRESPLVTLLARPLTDPSAQGASPFWDLVARRYVILVLSVASIACAGWYLGTGDLSRALEITTAILVVTCPCGIGIATPLGYELAGSALRRAGLFVRRERLLERVPQVRKIVFDKTGTLTTGTPRVANPRALETLSSEAHAMLAHMVARSAHPKSMAIDRALRVIENSAASALRVSLSEIPGHGLEARDGENLYRLGKSDWAHANHNIVPDADLAFTENGELLAALRFEEELRPDARVELEALREAGFETWILSGDEPARVHTIAHILGIPTERAIGGCTPDDKAEWIRTHDQNDTLFIGDGINDGPAADVAFAAGTPAIERPFLPSRADFWFATPGLRPIRLLLELGNQLRSIARRNLTFAVLYNVFAVTLAGLGWMEPWLAAVLMPASSLVVVTATSASLRQRKAKSQPGSPIAIRRWSPQWTS